MKKRGQESLQLTSLFEFIIGVLVAGILLYFVTHANDTVRMTGEYANKDYNIMKNIMEGKEGDYEITYKTGILTVKDGKFEKEEGLNIKADNQVKIKKEKGQVTIET